MTWLFTQVWLWSLAAFLLGSVFTWLLFVLPMRRRLNAIIKEYANRPSAAPGHPYNEGPHATSLDLFEAQRTAGGSIEAQASQPEFPGPGRWEPLPASWQGEHEEAGARDGDGLTELMPLHGLTGPPTPDVGFPAERPAPITGPDGRNSWFDGSSELAEPDSPAEPEASEETDHRVPPYVLSEDSEVTQVIPRIGDDPRSGAESAAPGEQFMIKGHFASRQYHPPDSPEYDRIVAEVWFRTVEDAEQAGFEHWNARPAS